MLICDGCGSTETIDEIRAKNPRAIACCPERKMIEVDALTPEDARALWMAMLDSSTHQYDL